VSTWSAGCGRPPDRGERLLTWTGQSGLLWQTWPLPEPGQLGTQVNEHWGLKTDITAIHTCNTYM